MAEALEKKFITVVMPVRNEEKFIAETIDMLLAQHYPPECFEIIVADGMSDDDTREIVSAIAAETPKVKLLDNPARRSSSGRNVGFKAGKGNYFLVVDGHCYIPSKTLLSDLNECFHKSGAACLGRPQPLDPPGMSKFQQLVAHARASWLGHGASSLIYSDYEGYASPTSNGAIYRAQVFDVVGYVDENFDACEDVEFNYRIEQAGLTSYMSPRLTVRYYPREKYLDLFKQLRRYGEGRFNLARKHPKTLGLATLAPPLFVAGIVLTLLLLAFDPAFGGLTLLLCLYGLYGGLAVFESLRVSRLRNYPFDWRLVAIFFTIHSGLGYGFLAAGAKHLYCVGLKWVRGR